MAHVGHESRPRVVISLKLLRRKGSGSLHADYLRLEDVRASIVQSYLIAAVGLRTQTQCVLMGLNYLRNGEC